MEKTKRVKISENKLRKIIKESIEKVLTESQKDNEETVMGEVHYYDAKGRQYRLNYLADELRNMGIKVTGTGFNDDYDGYVEVEVNLEQAKMLDKKYGSKFNMIGRGKTVEEIFADALRVDKMARSLMEGRGHFGNLVDMVTNIFNEFYAKYKKETDAHIKQLKASGDFNDFETRLAWDIARAAKYLEWMPKDEQGFVKGNSAQITTLFKQALRKSSIAYDSLKEEIDLGVLDAKRDTYKNIKSPDAPDIRKQIRKLRNQIEEFYKEGKDTTELTKQIKKLKEKL